MKIFSLLTSMAFPEVLLQYREKSLDLDEKLPEDLEGLGIREKVKAESSKISSWTFAGKTYKPQWVYAYLKVMDKSVVIDFRVDFRGVSPERFLLPDVRATFRYPLVFNSKGKCTGLGSSCLLGEVTGGPRSVKKDLSGLPLSKVKNEISAACKQFL